MKLENSPSFIRDMKRIRNQALRERVGQTLAALEAAPTLAEAGNVEKVASSSGQNYRVRVGDYRLGITVDDDTIILKRFLHRREIYRYFP